VAGKRRVKNVNASKIYSKHKKMIIQNKLENKEWVEIICIIR